MIKLKKLNSKLLIKSMIAILLFSIVTVVHSDPVTENVSEDPEVVFAEVDADPNVLMILDLSGSMGRNYGGEQIGSWDNDIITAECDSTPDSPRDIFCAANQGNHSLCAIQHCTNDGHRCETEAQVLAQQECIMNFLGIESTEVDIAAVPEGSIEGDGTESIDCLYNAICGDTDSDCDEGEDIDNCSTNEMNEFAYALEAIAGTMQCTPFASDGECLNDGIPVCSREIPGPNNDNNDDINAWVGCIDDVQDIIPDLRDQNCTGGTLNCKGEPRYGSSRMDIALNVILSFLDASSSGDDSLEDAMCNDSAGLWDNTTGDIKCSEFLSTPFRNVTNYIYKSSGNPDNLPTSPSRSVESFLTNEDAELLPFRFQPMSYTGEGQTSSCSLSSSSDTTVTYYQNAFRLPDEDDGEEEGFIGGTGESLQRVWEFYRDNRAGGGTPLAHILGFDNSVDTSSSGGTKIINDALLAFNEGFKNDDAIKCRTQFNIVITDGDDSCAGDCLDDFRSCSGTATASSNANRRSSIQAVSNLRTYFSRDPVEINGNSDNTVKKEVLTFVIGLGIQDDNAKRALNAMALAGGTHTKGIIRHCPPDVDNCNELNKIGNIIVNESDVCLDPNDDDEGIEEQLSNGASALCKIDEDGFPDIQVYRDFAIAKDIDSVTPENARLQGCGDSNIRLTNNDGEIPLIDGQCEFQSETLFDNTDFDLGILDGDTFGLSGDALADAQRLNNLEGFAFLVNSPEELLEALNDIENIINTAPTVGVAPSAPQSSINVSASDRIFLSLLKPIANEKIWQGRLALFGFVDSQDPDNPGTRTIIADPSGESSLDKNKIADLSIIDSNGNFDEDSQLFFWEAGKVLTEETNIANRNIITVDPTVIDTATTGARYIGEQKDFCCTNCTNTCAEDDQITYSELGIGLEDVDDDDNLPPSFCNDDNTDSEDVDIDLRDCSDDCELDVAGNFVDKPACQTCSKECLRDTIVDFMTGNTDVPTEDDSFGEPSNANSGSQSAGNTSMGFNCDENLDNCSIILGDIFHSVPVLVGSPSPLFFDIGFQNFAFNFLTRPAAVYVGANDGFLHSFHAGNLVIPGDDGEENPFTLETSFLPFFNEGSGKENFAFAPPTFLADSISENDPNAPSGEEPDFRFGDFKSYILENTEQRSFFDGSPAIGDVWIDGFTNGISSADEPDGEIAIDGSEWHTILVSGFRNGGGGITALDITNYDCGISSVDPPNEDNELQSISTPDTVDCTTVGKYINKTEAPAYPDHLWTVFDEHIGNTWSEPTFGRVRMQVGSGSNAQIVDRWVLFLGGGLDPKDTNPRDGVEFGNAFYVIDIATGQIIYKFHPDGDLTNDDDMKCEMASRINVSDLNTDGYADVAYGGDTCGRLWRFDVSMPIETDDSISSTGRVTPTNGRAVITAPNWTGGVAFCTGTGCKSESGDPTIPDNDDNLQSIYFAPTVAIDNFGRRHVIFQTGDRRDILALTRLNQYTDEAGVVTEEETDQFGRLFNFIDNFVPAFLNGGTSTGGALRSETDLIDNNQLVKLTFSSTGENGPTDDDFNGEDTKFEADTPDGFDTELGEFVVEFPNNNIDFKPEGENASQFRGEKGIGTPVVLNSVLFFTSFAPFVGEDDPCEAAPGQGRLFALDFVTGESAFVRIPGASIFLDDTNDSSIAGITAGKGVPTVPQLTFGKKGSVIATIAFSGSPTAGGSQFVVFNLGFFPTRTQTLFWEEII